MKDILIDRLQKLSECMAPGCDKCPSLHKGTSSEAESKAERCCDASYCAFTKLHFMALEQSYEEVPLDERVKPEIPYLKKGTGCVIEPEHRPFCTMYACNAVLHHDRKLRREYNRLHDKLKIEPEILRLGELHQEAVRILAQKQRVF